MAFSLSWLTDSWFAELIKTAIKKPELIEALFKGLKLIRNIPPADWREWLKELAAVADVIAKTTETEADDKIVDAVDAVLNNDTAYAYLEKLLNKYIADDQTAEGVAKLGELEDAVSDIPKPSASDMPELEEKEAKSVVALFQLFIAAKMFKKILEK